MTDVERDILGALTELDNQIRSLPQVAVKPNLLPLFTRIDQLASQLPSTASPELRHYLQKKSYQKAMLFLLGRDEENSAGNCGHV